MDNSVGKKENKHGRALNWLISAAVNLIILAAVFRLTDVFYESNDDFAISQEILAGYPFVGFVNYYLCKALVFIQGMLPEMNAFVLSQIVASFIAFCVILRIFLDRRGSLFELAPAILIIAFFSFDHYSAVQFTKTAALLMTAGLLWVVDNYTHERRPAGFLLGFALFCLGVAFRQKGMFPALAFAACFMLIWWALNGREYFRGKKPLPEVCLVVLILALLLAPYGFDKMSDRKNESTPELKYFREYQAERVLLTDYPFLDYYEQNEEQYREAGLGYNDLEMIDRWLFDYDGAASLENLKKINEINRPYAQQKSSVAEAFTRTLGRAAGSVLDLDYNGMHILIAAALALCILVSRKPKSWLYILGIGAVSVAVYVAIHYMQRPQYRALYVADESAAFWLMYAAMISERNVAKMSKAAGVLVLAACSAMIIWMTPNAIGRNAEWCEYNAAIVEAPEVTDYFADHMDNYYIGPTTTMKQPASYTTPLSLPLAPANVSGTGGWETLSPYKLGLLGKYGVTNPITGLLDAQNIYFFGDSKQGMLKEYYNKWYCEEGEYVEFIKVDEVNGNGIYSVVRKQQVR